MLSPRLKAEIAPERVPHRQAPIGIVQGVRYFFRAHGTWKKMPCDRATELFETWSSIDLEKITDPLYKGIGRLKMDIEWLKKTRRN